MSKQERKQQRQFERAQEDVQRALARRDGGGAAEHLLLLPRDQREDLLPKVAPAFGAEVRSAYAARDLGRLQRLAARADAEPRLVLLAGSELPDAEVAFALCLTALRGREWPRAERLLALLVPALTPRSPHLLAWLQAFLQHRGQIPAEVTATLAPLPAPPQSDPRLGYDAVGKAARLVAPRQEAELEPAISALFARETSPRRLWDTLSNWQRDLAEPLRPQMAIVAAPYLLRAALQARRAGQSINAALLALAELVRGAPPQLLPDITLALRLVSAGLPADPAVPAPPELMRLLLGMARICLGYEELRATVAEQLLRTLIHRDSAAQALAVLESLLPGLPAGTTRPALLVKTLTVWALSQVDVNEDAGAVDPDKRAPSWLTQELRAALADGSLMTHLVQLEQRELAKLRSFLQVSSSALPMDLCEAMIVALLPKLEEQGRRELANFLMALSERANEISDDEAVKWARQSGRNPAKATAKELLNLMREQGADGPPDFLMAMLFPGERLPQDMHSTYAQLLWKSEMGQHGTPTAKRLLSQHGMKLLPYLPALLEPLLEAAPDLTAKRLVLERYLAEQSTIDGYMDLLANLHCENCAPGLFRDLVMRMMTTFASDGSALARALLRAVSAQLSDQLVKALAIAVCGVADAGKLPPGVDNARSLELARRLAPPPRKKAPAKKAPAKKTPKAKKAAPAKKKPAPAKRAAAPKKKPAAQPVAPPEPAAAPAKRTRKTPVQAELPFERTKR